MIRARFRTDVSTSAEWCYFETKAYDVDFRRLPSSAATLRPGGPPPLANLAPGAGVREAVTSDTDGRAYGGFQGNAGDARFLLRGSTLTVRLSRGFRAASLVTLACASETGPRHERVLGYRSVVLPARQRVVTGDLEDDASSATSCLIEGTGVNSGDIAAASF